MPILPAIGGMTRATAQAIGTTMSPVTAPIAHAARTLTSPRAMIGALDPAPIVSTGMNWAQGMGQSIRGGLQGGVMGKNLAENIKQSSLLNDIKSVLTRGHKITAKEKKEGALKLAITNRLAKTESGRKRLAELEARREAKRAKAGGGDGPPSLIQKTKSGAKGIWGWIGTIFSWIFSPGFWTKLALGTSMLSGLAEGLREWVLNPQAGLKGFVATFLEGMTFGLVKSEDWIRYMDTIGGFISENIWEPFKKFFKETDFFKDHIQPFFEDDKWFENSIKNVKSFLVDLAVKIVTGIGAGILNIFGFETAAKKVAKGTLPKLEDFIGSKEEGKTGISTEAGITGMQAKKNANLLKTGAIIAGGAALVATLYLGGAPLLLSKVGLLALLGVAGFGAYKALDWFGGAKNRTRTTSDEQSWVAGMIGGHESKRNYKLTKQQKMAQKRSWANEFLEAGGYGEDVAWFDEQTAEGGTGALKSSNPIIQKQWAEYMKIRQAQTARYDAFEELQFATLDQVMAEAEKKAYGAGPYDAGEQARKTEMDRLRERVRQTTLMRRTAKEAMEKKTKQLQSILKESKIPGMSAEMHKENIDTMKKDFRSFASDTLPGGGMAVADIMEAQMKQQATTAAVPAIITDASQTAITTNNNNNALALSNGPSIKAVDRGRCAPAVHGGCPA